ncbi:MAG: APC family permease [Defluviitaleaceae bacterium]|nr:APC family permease [Defluviitaleaceae bacterium]
MKETFSTTLENGLKRQYGFFVTLCIVIGFVVGTGIFWRPGRVLLEAGGSVYIGVLAWVVGGIVIASCVYMFAVMASHYERMHGMVDYAEIIVGKRYGYLAGWFFCVMYQTAGYAIIAYISASFTATLAGHYNVTNSPFVFFIAGFYMNGVFVLNYINPKIAIKLNNVTTVARLIPLMAMGTIGVSLGFMSESSVYSYTENYTLSILYDMPPVSFLGAVFTTAFAYNGWQAAVAFNSEINNGKKTFPLALLLGFFIVIVVYVLYFIGITYHADPAVIMENNQLGTRQAFENVFGMYNIIMVFVIISGLGILNMCCMGMSRSMYALACRGVGPIPKRMAQLDSYTNVPVCSMIICVGLSFLWLGVIFGNQNDWFTVMGQPFSFDLPDFYNMVFFALIIPIFIGFIIKHKNTKTIHAFNRTIAPALAAAGAGFMIFALVVSGLLHAVVYTAVFVILAIIGFILK